MSAPDPIPDLVLATTARVLRIEGEALIAMADRLPDGIAGAVERLMATKGRVILTGIGKSGHIARKIAATFSSTGTPALFVHPAEASHGDLGTVMPGDLVIALSNSGETTELGDLVAHTRRLRIALIAITAQGDSTLARAADLVLLLPPAPEACIMGLAPTTSTTMALALGDALAVALMHRRGFNREDFQIFHPGGKLGAQLLKVEALMHTGDSVPTLTPDTPMGDALLVMTSKGFGMAGVVEDGILAGVITDGDLRRNLATLMDRTAGEVATHAPKTVRSGALVSEALRVMNAAKIGALFVVSEAGHVEGILHLHDCLRAGVA